MVFAILLQYQKSFQTGNSVIVFLGAVLVWMTRLTTCICTVGDSITALNWESKGFLVVLIWMSVILLAHTHILYLHTSHSSDSRTALTPRILSCHPGWCRARSGTWPGTFSRSLPRSLPAPRPCQPEPGASYQERRTCSRKSSPTNREAQLSFFLVGVLRLNETLLDLAVRKWPFLLKINDWT